MLVGTSILIFILFIVVFLQLLIIYEKFTKKKLSEYVSEIQFVSIITGLWILYILILASTQEKEFALNNWGDFLAGFSSPLLFIWLVYGVFLQKGEFTKVVESFEHQKTEVEKSVEAMRAQVVQVEVQQLNTWFNRNTQTINTIKDSLIRTLNMNITGIDSIALIKESFKKDISLESSFFNIFDELKSILNISFYIEEYLDNLEKENIENKVLVDSISNLRHEFKMLFESELNDIKIIMSIVYFLIASKDAPNYEKYSMYSQWLENTEDLKNEIMNTGQSSIEDALKVIVKKIDSVNIDLKTGKLNGTI